MLPTDPLPLHHSWPLYESGCRFEHGRLHDLEGGLATAAGLDGSWSFDFSDQALTWSRSVYELFGMNPARSAIRSETVKLYGEESRAPMERLRSYAIRHRRGFTLDARITTLQGEKRWMRLIAAPVCQSGQVMGLHGVKQDVTVEYGR
ncbi:PAS domain S-box protein [Sphingomonas sp. Leaf343]|uniref:PAS domain S-box protein n=1 Tax=Sphingomonas sp. Leaf343 TaxID=1736345 RepID=UPI0009EB94E0|nr:PAS domain S-box protein [Sphingomonas sp. Leaf343]